MTDFGLALNAFAIFSFVVALFTIPLSEVFMKVSDFYYGLRRVIYYPIEGLIGWTIPPLLKDASLFWVITGAIGARTTLWLGRRFFEAADSALKKLDNQQVCEAAKVAMGEEKFIAEREWVETVREQYRSSRDRTITLYVGCLLTGPLFFAQIWRVAPPIPGGTISGRQMIIVQIVAVCLVLSMMFVLNWVTL